MKTTLDLSACNEFQRIQVQEAFDQGDGARFAYSIDNHKSLDLVFANTPQLTERGIYEAALVAAYGDTRVNFARWELGLLECMFARADRERLRSIAPLPPGARFTLYRGVAGPLRFRHVTGMSWTRSLETAVWFATRFRLADPGVYVTEVCAADVYAYIGGRKEDDFVYRARRYRRLRWSDMKIKGQGRNKGESDKSGRFGCFVSACV